MTKEHINIRTADDVVTYNVDGEKEIVLPGFLANEVFPSYPQLGFLPPVVRYMTPKINIEGQMYSVVLIESKPSEQICFFKQRIGSRDDGHSDDCAYHQDYDNDCDCYYDDEYSVETSTHNLKLPWLHWVFILKHFSDGSFKLQSFNLFFSESQIRDVDHVFYNPVLPNTQTTFFMADTEENFYDSSLDNPIHKFTFPVSFDLFSIPVHSSITGLTDYDTRGVMGRLSADGGRLGHPCYHDGSKFSMHTTQGIKSVNRILYPLAFNNFSQFCLGYTQFSRESVTDLFKLYNDFLVAFWGSTFNDDMHGLVDPNLISFLENSSFDSILKVSEYSPYPVFKMQDLLNHFSNPQLYVTKTLNVFAKAKNLAKVEKLKKV